MADSSVEVTSGSGTPVDTRTVGTGDHRQVVVLGDPTTNTGVAPVDVTYGLAVDVKRSELPSGAATAARQDTGNTSLSSIDGKVTACNTGAVVVSSSALPSGAATSANQDTGNASLSSIDGKTPALGQALAAASVPVVLTAAQVSTLTPPAAITGFATESTLSTLNAKVTAVNTGAVVVSSSALPTGAATESTLSTLNGKVTACNTGAVVVSSSALPSGAATESTLSTLNGKVTACNTGAVTIGAALPAGTNAIGKLAANDGVDIGDVSINNGSSILPTLVPASSGAGAIQGNSGFSLNMIRLATRTCGSGSTTTSIVSTSHGAVVGNIVQFISGAASPSWSYVSAVPDANTITLAWPLLGAPASGNSFIVGYQVPVSAVGGFTSADTGTATLVAMNTLGGVNSGGSNLLKLEDSAAASGDAGVMLLAVRNDSAATFAGTTGDYSAIAVNSVGAVQINIDASSQTGTSLIRSEDAAASTGQPGVPALFKRTDALASQTSTDGDYSLPTCNAHGAMYTDPIRRGTFTHTQPTIANTTSVTLVASNAERRYLLIQNNSAANVMVSLNNDTLTGIAPTATNLGIVIAAGAAYESPSNACPTAAVTVYQSSGGSINTVSVIEGS